MLPAQQRRFRPGGGNHAGSTLADHGMAAAFQGEDGARVVRQVAGFDAGRLDAQVDFFVVPGEPYGGQVRPAVRAGGGDPDVLLFVEALPGGWVETGGGQMDNHHPEPQWTCGELTLHLHSKTASVKKQPVFLTPLEFKLLHYLLFTAHGPCLRRNCWNTCGSIRMGGRRTR